MTESLRRLNEVRIRGFRRLAEVQVELRPLNVLIGANGAGKTSFLDALELLAKSASGGMRETVNEMAGLESMITYDHDDMVSFGISERIEGQQSIKYDFTLQSQRHTYSIKEECLTQCTPGNSFPSIHIDSRPDDIKYYDVEDGRMIRPTWEHSPVESSLSQVPKQFKVPEEFRRRLSSYTYYHSLNVEPRSPVRRPQLMSPAQSPGKNGEDLVSCLYYLRETEPDRYQVIEDTMKAAFPGFKRLDFPPVAAGMLAMTWRDSSFSKPIYAHQLSEGRLRFLWLITLFHSPGPAGLTLIDEPEVSLHPELLGLFADLLREATRRTQVVVATDSNRLIGFLSPDEVLAMDLVDDGTCHMTWADKMDLDEWMNDYSLDELWTSGQLGARA